jgi:hypothetical protein
MFINAEAVLPKCSFGVRSFKVLSGTWVFNFQSGLTLGGVVFVEWERRSFM